MYLLKEVNQYRKNKAPFHAVPPARGASAPLPPAGAAAARGGSGTTAGLGPAGGWPGGTAPGWAHTAGGSTRLIFLYSLLAVCLALGIVSCFTQM
jgi:hypothetical protein